jgi:hypothetical protein
MLDIYTLWEYISFCSLKSSCSRACKSYNKLQLGHLGHGYVKKKNGKDKDPNPKIQPLVLQERE